jgi:holin-like protein
VRRIHALGGGNMSKAIIAASQIGALCLLCWLGHLVTQTLNLPVPANVIGMLMLLALLGSGILPLSWIEAGAQALLSHLAFFFVPIAVGLMAFTDLLQRDGVAWLVTLVLAAAAGILCAGYVTQALLNRSRVREQAKEVMRCQP